MVVSKHLIHSKYDILHIKITAFKRKVDAIMSQLTKVPVPLKCGTT